jgi:hypothetical protein
MCIAFPWQSGYVNGPHCYVVYTLPVMLKIFLQLFDILTEIYCVPSVWLSYTQLDTFWGCLQELILKSVTCSFNLNSMYVCFFPPVHHSSVTYLCLNYCFLKSVQTKHRYAASSKHRRVIDIFLTLEQLETWYLSIYLVF